MSTTIMATRKLHVEKNFKFNHKKARSTKRKQKEDLDAFNSDDSEAGSDLESIEDVEDRLHGSAEDEEPVQESTQSSMANVLARILSKDVSKSNRVVLAKGKTNKEIERDILERKRAREETDGLQSKVKKKDTELKEEKIDHHHREEKKKIWESMARKKPTALDLPKEARLRKIATQGMVQLFRSVHEHQKVMNQKLSAVGSSERKRDKVMSEFTKGKFLDLLKGGANKEVQKADTTKDSGKWKILKDDFMMGAQMKDWDKEDNDDDGSDADEMALENDDQDMDVDSFTDDVED